MKKLSLITALFVIIFSACSAGEDVVEGSIPPKQEGKVKVATREVILFFKGEIDPASLLLGDTHTYVEVRYGSTYQLLAGTDVFKNGVGDFPILRKNHVNNDALILSLQDNFTIKRGRSYTITMDKHNLLCTTIVPEPEGCIHRTGPFVLALHGATPDAYHSPWDGIQEPPYIVRMSPPDEADFSSPPLFPPHGDIQVWLSEPVPTYSAAISPANAGLPWEEIALAPDDTENLDGDHPSEPFNSAEDTKQLIRTVKGWPINSEISFYIISRPLSVDDDIAACIDPYATECHYSALSNVLLTPTMDTSGAPIIAASASTMEPSNTVAGTFWGVYQQPSGDFPGLGNKPDNIDILFHFAKIRIDFPYQREFFNADGATVTGIYTRHVPAEDQDVSGITIKVDGVTQTGTINMDAGANGTDWATFTYRLSGSFSLGDPHEIRAVASAISDNPGFDFVNATAVDDHNAPTIVITSPENGSYTSLDWIQVTGTVSDPEGHNIMWVKVDGNPATLNAGSFTYLVRDLPAGEHEFDVTAADGAGNTSLPTTTTVHIDYTPPNVTITSPMDGSYLNTRQIAVEGTVIDPDNSPIPTVLVNGQAVTPIDGSFSCTLNAGSDGSYGIQVLAWDQAGNLGSNYVGVVVDTVPPTLTIVDPPDGATTNYGISIHITYGDATSGVDLSTLLVYQNDTDITSTLTEGSTSSTGSATGATGGNVFNVWIKDQAGNQAFDSALVMIEDGLPPTVTFISPEPNMTVNTPTPLFEIGLQDSGAGVNFSTLVILIGGVNYTNRFIVNGGLATWDSMEGDAFADGTYQIEVHAADGFGNATVQYSTFQIYSTCPASRFDSITPNFTIGGDAVVITGTGFSNTIDLFFGNSVTKGISVRARTFATVEAGATVPGSAVTGKVWIVNPAGSACKRGPLPFTMGLPYVYITNRNSNRVTVIDYRNNSVVKSVLIPGASPTPYSADVTPDGRWVLIANRATNNVTILDTLDNNTVKIADATLCSASPQNPQQIAITPDGSRAFVATNNKYVVAIDIKRKLVAGDTCTGVENKSYSNGSSFWDIDFTPDGQRAIIATDYAGTGSKVYQIDSSRYYMIDGNSNSHYLKGDFYTEGGIPSESNAQRQPYGLCILPQRLASDDWPWGTLIVNKGAGSDTDEDICWLDVNLWTSPGLANHDVLDTNFSGHPNCYGGVDATVSNLGERAFVVFSNSNNIGVTGALASNTNDVLAATAPNYYNGNMREVAFTPYFNKVFATIFASAATPADSRVMILDGSTAAIPMGTTGTIATSKYTSLQDSSINGPEGIGMQPLFDRDKDGISDLVEAANAEGILQPEPVPGSTHFITYYLNPAHADAIISIANGNDATGTITGAVRLPEEGIGYRHFYGTDPPNGSDDWAILRTIQVIEKVGREWNLLPNLVAGVPRPRISIGDMSIPNGGPRPGVGGHANGKEIDVRYVRNGGSEAPFDFDVNPVVQYDDTATQQLVDLFCKGGVYYLYADTQGRDNLVAQEGCTINRTDASHHHHFHAIVR